MELGQDDRQARSVRIMDGARTEPEIFRQDKAGGREREVTTIRSPDGGERRGRADFDSLSSDFLALVLP